MTLTKSSETATHILQTAYRRLAIDGYARLNMHDVATEAGVNHALIHYYFRSKDQLVIAVLDEAGRRMDFEQATPEVIAAAIAEEIGRKVVYRDVECDGAARAAGRRRAGPARLRDRSDRDGPPAPALCLAGPEARARLVDGRRRCPSRAGPSQPGRDSHV